MPELPRHLRIVGFQASQEAGLFVHRVQVTKRVASHDHDFLEIVVVTGGRAVHRTLYGEQTIHRHHVLVIQPRQWHAYERCRRLTVWNCGISQQLLKHELAWTATNARLGMILGSTWHDEEARGVLQGRLPPALLHRATAALRYLADGLEDPAVRIGWLLIFLGIVGQVLAARAAHPIAPNPLHPAVRRVLDAVERDLSADWTLPRMADIARLNRAYLVRLFRRHLGHSPVAWLIRRRCERAAALLIETDKPVGTIGLDVGWMDANYFGRRFRCHFQQTPSDFRAKHRRRSAS